MSQDTAHELFNGSAIARVMANAALGARRGELRQPGVIYEPHTLADDLFYIESGQVRIYQVGPDDSTRLVDIFGPGDWFGAPALARCGTYGARAQAITPAVIWKMPAQRLAQFILQEPYIALELVAQLARKLQAANEAAAELTFNDCNQRLIQALLKFSDSAAATPQDGGDVVLRITHQQLAQAVGAARETVSLALSQLRLRNVLKTGRNRLFFNPQALRQLCVDGPVAQQVAN